MQTGFPGVEDLDWERNSPCIHHTPLDVRQGGKAAFKFIFQSIVQGEVNRLGSMGAAPLRF
jgi:hypothetical protein